MALDPNNPNNPLAPLKEFQLSGDSRTKSDIKFGEKIVLQVRDLINSGYFNERNMRFVENRKLATGRMDMSKFMDLLDMNGKTNYVNINWKSIMIVNTIISRLVGRWMQNKEKVNVTAVDPVSIKQKKKEQDDAEFVLENRDMIATMEQESGVQLISPDQFIPDDKDHLDLWVHEEQRLPEEILTEKGISTVLTENGWDEVLKRKLLHDSAEVGLIGTETWADADGKIHVDYCKPENIFYSYSEMPDFRDASIMGDIQSKKITELRALYPKITEKEWWEISKSAKEWRTGNLITYDSGWDVAIFRPYDDWNIDIVCFELRTLDKDRNLIKTGKDGRMYVDKPKKKIDSVFPGNEYIEKEIWNIYRGVFVKDTNKILEWGLRKNMIRPQDYKKGGLAEFSYSFYMYQNVGMRNLAVPEKIEEPVEQMILSRLKIQQLVAKMRASGLLIDVDGMQSLDLGTGDLKPLEIQRVYDQTGNQYYRGKDAEGQRIDSPIKELPNAGSVQQLKMLIELYNYHLQVVRDEIGINEFAEGQSIKPRISSQNVEASLEISFNATDYMQDACISLMTETSKKVTCLLKDSVEFGSKAYREIMNEATVKDREFAVQVNFLPTKEEILYVENMLNAAIASNPEFILYVDPFKIKRIARENVKLAEQYLRRAQRRAIEGSMKQAQAQSKWNGDLQMQSAKAKAKGDAQLKDIEQAGKQSLATQEFVQQAMLLQMQPGNVTPPHVQSMIDIYVANIAKQEAEKQQQELIEKQQEMMETGQGEEVIDETIEEAPPDIPQQAV